MSQRRWTEMTLEEQVDEHTRYAFDSLLQSGTRGLRSAVSYIIQRTFMIADEKHKEAEKKAVRKAMRELRNESRRRNKRNRAVSSHLKDQRGRRSAVGR